MDLLLNTTPVNAAEAWADFERSDFGDRPHSSAEAAGLRAGSGATRPLQPRDRERGRPCAAHTASGRSETRSHDRSRPWRIATLRGSSTRRCSSTEGSPRLSCPSRTELLEHDPRSGSQHAERDRGGLRGGRSCGAGSIPRGVPGLSRARRGARRRLRPDGVVRPTAHPRGRRVQDGPRRAIAASRGRHPCGHLSERRQATPDASEGRAAWVRRDPRGTCRACRVSGRWTGSAASPGARGESGRRRKDARRGRIPGDLRIAPRQNTGCRRGPLGPSPPGSSSGAVR